MTCQALWEKSVLRIGDRLADQYLARLTEVGLIELALEADRDGDAGGADSETTDRHFALQFANSAGRAVYVSIDPLEALEDLSRLVQGFFSDGRVLLIEIPCGAGAGSLGLLSAILEQRRAGLLPTLPLYIDLLGGDISQRGLDHFEALTAKLCEELGFEEIHVQYHAMIWDASDIRSSSRLIDSAVSIGEQCDQIFLLVSNFSEALTDQSLRTSFEHFLSQFAGRLADTTHAICWTEPASNKGRKALSTFRGFLENAVRWLGVKIPSDGGVRYSLFDPVTAKEVRSSVRVLRSHQSGMP